MNNAAIVCEIKNVRPHPNADKVKLGVACGYQVVIGLTVNEGDLGIYFPVDTCLGQDFANANKHLLTYFGKNFRVRVQKFRGEKSEGFWCPIQHLEDVIGHIPKKGTELTNEVYSHITLSNVEICKKYVNPATLKHRKLVNNIIRSLKSGSLNTFQQHVETQHLRKVWETIPRNRQWIWTDKLHGTSARVGYVLVPNTTIEHLAYTIYNLLNAKCKKPFCKKISEKLVNNFLSVSSWWNRVGSKFGFKTSNYEYLIGSRKVILGEIKPDGSKGKDTFYGDEFRKKAAQPFIGKLHKGEIVYYEIVGYSDPEKPIMPQVSVKDEDIAKLYGNNVTYTYGCQDGQFDIYVYRIAYQTEEKQSIDLSWDQVKLRCAELGVKHVPEIDHDIQKVWNSHENPLEHICSYIEQPDLIDKRHPMEGVVLRVEGSTPEFFKEKSFTFKILEGIAIDSGAVDLEEAS